MRYDILRKLAGCQQVVDPRGVGHTLLNMLHMDQDANPELFALRTVLMRLDALAHCLVGLGIALILEIDRCCCRDNIFLIGEYTDADCIHILWLCVSSVLELL